MTYLRSKYCGLRRGVPRVSSRGRGGRGSCRPPGARASCVRPAGIRRGSPRSPATTSRVSWRCLPGAPRAAPAACGGRRRPGARRAGPRWRPRPPRPAPVRPQNGPAGVGPRGLLAVIIAGGAVVVALWWHSTPGASGLGGWLTGAGEVLGLLCGYGVVVLVALMSRLPPLERGLGTDQLARRHPMGGRYIVKLVVAHRLLLVWGYAVEAPAGAARATP